MNELVKIFQEREREREREENNLFTMLVENLQLFDREYFFKNVRVDRRTFEDLLSWIDPIVKKSFLRRSNATPVEGLCVTLLYLATLKQQLVQATG